jgi:N-acetylglucosaminyldiphosphoundecaprenol N-acetyl-beta-D-mannosaminyltransferase
MREQVTILNCNLDNLCKDELLERFKQGVLIPTNVDMIVKMQKDREFYSCHCNADFRVCDSQIVRMAGRILGKILQDTIAGSDFFPLFYMHHRNNEEVRIFLLGAAEGVGEKAMEKINAKVNRKIVVESYSPPYGFERDEIECIHIIEKINKSKATVLAVGLGAPKQEKWVFKYKERIPLIKRILCIGATIDFEAGHVRRAPKVLKMIGLEWLFRLILEPRRLWKRYLIDDMSFFGLVALQKAGLYKNPFQKE